MLASVAGRVPRPRTLFGAGMDALTRPGEFFAARPDPSPWTTAAVVAVAGLSNATQAAVINAQFGHLMPGWLFVAWMAGVTLVLVAFALALWVAVSAVLYALSYPVARRGGGRELLAYAGWGLLPMGLLGPVLAAAALVAVSQVGAPGAATSGQQFVQRVTETPLVALAAAAGTTQVVATAAVEDVGHALGPAVTLWAGYVWLGALEEARGLSRRTALAVTALPVGLQLLWHAA